jgi:myosin protein heavy chain
LITGKAHSLLKTEKETLSAQVSRSTEEKSKLEFQCSDLQEKHESTHQKLTKVTEERDNLIAQKPVLEQSVQGKDATIAGLHAQLAAAGTEISSQKRQVQTLQNDLRIAQKRVDDSERTQQRLQSEGTNLMRSLDELRPKVVELTEDKVQLSEKLAHLEHELRDRDNIISNLEAGLEEAKEETESSQIEWRARLSKAELERSQAATSSSEMEKGFSELQKELDDALDSIRALESERQSLRQETQSRFNEVEQLSTISRSQAAKITKLQYELNERRAAQVSIAWFDCR